MFLVILMAGKNEVILKVAEAFRSDAGRGIVRLDTQTRRKLDVMSGDIVKITGKRETAAIVWQAHPQDEGLGIIRMDGILRQNADVSIGDKVKVEKIEPKPASKIVLAPTQPISFSPGFEEYVKNRILGRPVVKGDRLLVGVFGQALMLFVVNTKPKGIVQITEDTVLELKKEPVKELQGVPQVTYEDIGGLKDAIQKIREMVEIPMKHPELFERLGIEPPKGVLLYGPPGTGKTLLAKAVANETDAHFIAINGPEIMSKFVGEAEERLRQIFKEAQENAPTIIFIDEIDAIAPKREETIGEVERRVVAQLLALMDGLQSRGQVVVIAATNRPNAIDPALRRPGRFDREIEIGVPDRNGRKEILQIHTRNMPIEPDYSKSLVVEELKKLRIDDKLKERILKKLNGIRKPQEIKKIIEKELPDHFKDEFNRRLVDRLLDYLADRTYGFVGADLAALCKEAAMKALRRILPKVDLDKEEIPREILESLMVTKNDFMDALREIQPSAMREVLVEIPKVKWSDIGDLDEAKQELKEAVEWPLKYPDMFERMGIRPPKGILLYGPPGTGKTLLAKAVANESGANFIAVKGPELLSKWVGESEKGIREVFRKARQVAPCVIFFDEIDALAPRRGLYEGSHVTESVVNQLLTEMDGIEDMRGVVVIAATNRPDLVDPGLLRPGRFDRLILVPAPDEKGRLEILKVHTKKVPLADDVNLKDLAKKTDGFSGADIEALVREAVMTALRENKDAKEVKKKHFEVALKKIRPSIKPEMMKYYLEFKSNVSGPSQKGKNEPTYYG